MDAKVNIPSRRLPGCQMTAGAAEAPQRSHLDDAMHGFEIFKKTSYIPGFKPSGRDLAQHMPEVGDISFLMKTLLDHSTLNGVGTAGLMIAGPWKSAMRNPAAGAGASDFNVKLTDKETPARTSEQALRATNHMSGTFGKNAWQVGLAADGSVTRRGAALEKQCYADV